MPTKPNYSTIPAYNPNAEYIRSHRLEKSKSLTYSVSHDEAEADEQSKWIDQS